MKKKIQILGVILAIILSIYIGFGIVKFTADVIISKVTLLLAIIFCFWQYKTNHQEIIKVILLVLMTIGFFVFHVFYNIIFFGIIALFIVICRNKSFQKIGALQIILIVLGISYLITFGIFASLSKIIATFILFAIFMAIVWDEISIYFIKKIR